ncbi:fruit body lectin [Hypoxylon sp. NC0597]|nr:fruit body lectin [Hypoxylon sp. NC0597]
MAYTIKTRVYQTNTNAYFNIVERGVWHYANGGTWVEERGAHKLTMDESGTSGMLRFVSEGGKEAFWVVVGIHGDVRWVDIVTNLTGGDTCVKSLPEYYNGTKPDRVAAREAQRDSWAATNDNGRRISAKYVNPDGPNFELDIVIG